MRSTSRAAYERAEDEGILSRRRFLAYSTLLQRGPMTGQELSEAASVPGLWKRLSELEGRGYVRTTGTRLCAVTGFRAFIWQAVRRTVRAKK